MSWIGHSSSLATERTHIPHRDVKLRNLLGRQYLLPGLNPRHLSVLTLQSYSIGGSDVRIRLFTLAPGEVIPWHSHSEIADEFFVVARGIAIRKKGGLFATEPARQYAR